MIYHYTLPFLVLDSVTGVPVPNRTDGVLLDGDGNEVATTTPYGVPTRVTTSPVGTTAPFLASIPAGRVRFGTVDVAVWADENFTAAERAEQAAALAQQTLDKVTWIGENASEVTYLYRSPDGSVMVSDTPVITGGGKPRVTADGDVFVTFPDDV